MPIIKEVGPCDKVNTLGYKLSLLEQVIAITNLAETKQRTYSSSKQHNETQPVCKTTIYWATKYTLDNKNKAFWHQSGPESKEE